MKKNLLALLVLVSSASLSANTDLIADKDVITVTSQENNEKKDVTVENIEVEKEITVEVEKAN
ncbi:hypothetical protein KJ644_03550 [Candidatus Dependentiae bacterium]|nr:hypothetical protein [Candidatus Dependentiae bacterium]MBU4387522.1 hypothetical protein [Candidatus Dependentiae bacterium]MCG2756555.1 hypothetical protein [Candidatus Dependentiae bacterium]